MSNEGGLKESVCELVSVGRINDAIETLQAIINQNPRHAEAHELLGCIFYRVGRLKDAVSAFRRAVFLNPDNPDYLYNLATALYALGDRLEAGRVVSECLKRRPDHGDAKRMVERLQAEGYRIALRSP
ncbi:MAG: tetratricopeptide repeat protein [Candidatus Caldarchaeum sp.]